MSEPQTNETATRQLAMHLRQVHFGGNWTASNLKDQLADVTWREATTQVRSFHTVAALVYHMNYYVSATLRVLQGGPLDAKDEHSFDLPPIESQEAWDELLKKTWDDAESLASAIEQLPERQLWENFVKIEYGSYYRCLLGPIEHCHYHLGQIALIKAILKAEDSS